MADLKITAELDITESEKQIRDDLEQIERDLQADRNTRINVIAQLDEGESLFNIRSQLDYIISSVNTPVITIGANIDNAVGQQIQTQMQTAETQVKQSVNNITSNLSRLNAKEVMNTTFNIGINIDETIKNAQQVLSKFGTVTFEWTKNAEGNLNTLTATIKDSYNVVENFVFELQEIENAEAGIFRYAGGTGNDRGLHQQQERREKEMREVARRMEEVYADYERKLREFTNTNSAIMSGLDTSAFKEALANINPENTENNIRSLETLKNAVAAVKNEFNNLKSAASDITTHLNTTNSSLNKGTNAVNHYKEMGSIIENLSKSFKSLKNQPEELNNKLKIAQEGLEALQSITNSDNQQIYNTTWAQGYHELNVALKDIETEIKTIQGVEKQFQTDLDNSLNTVNKHINDLDKLNNNTVFKNNSANSEVQQQKQQISELIQKYQAYKDELKEKVSTERLAEIKHELVELDNEFENVRDDTKAFQTHLRNSVSSDKLNSSIDNLISRIEKFRTVNTKAEKQFGTTFDGMIEDLKALRESGDLTSFQAINRKFQTLENTIKVTGQTGKTFFEKLKEQAEKFSSWMTLTGVITKAWQTVRNMVNEVIELDSAMTELKKVTDETEYSYSKFLKSVSKQAQEMHSTMSDLIKQTSEWAKLGFNMQTANNLAKVSMIYSKVGEVDNEQAVTNIITAMKAFDVAARDAMSIPDVYNKLGNEFAVSSKNLGAGMSQAATTLAMAGNDFNQTAALLTGAGEILGDDKLDQIGNGLKTVSLRIQNQAGALKDLGEEYEDLISVSKTQQEIFRLTGGTVNIMSDTDPNTFRSTYDILKDVSVVIKDMNDKDASELIQLLFGKNRANVGTSILKAFQSGQIEKAYEAAVNSAGSAQKEFDKWSESIEAHIETFKASFESLSNTVVDSELVKTVVDVGTGILNILDGIIDKAGMVNTALGAFAIGASFKNAGEHIA